jgi:DNA-directed RNA polymerase specialized sigma24 family protein
MIFLFVLSDDESKDRISEYYLKNVDRLISIARQILNNIYDAEDAVQNAFIAIAESPKTAEIEDEKFDNWCVVIVKHNTRLFL